MLSSVRSDIARFRAVASNPCENSYSVRECLTQATTTLLASLLLKYDISIIKDSGIVRCEVIRRCCRPCEAISQTYLGCIFAGAGIPYEIASHPYSTTLPTSVPLAHDVLYTIGSLKTGCEAS